MLESENYSIFVPELAEMLDDAPDADTAMETEKTVAINLKSSEQIAAEAAIAENTPVADTASPAAFAAAEAAAGQEMDTPVNSVQQQVSVLASDIVPGSTPEALNAPIPEQQAVIRAGDIVPGSAAIPESVNTPIPAAESIHANDIVPGIVMPASAQTPDPAVIHANDIVPGSTVMPASAQTPDTTAIHANDIVPGSTVMPASTQTPDTAVIHADDIVPGNPAAVRQDGVMGQMQINNITPKIEGYQGAETKTVTPSQTSPFTFIDIE